MIKSYINDLPIEILEIIFSLLPSVVDQTNLCLVCQHWRLIVLGLRHFQRKQSQLAWTPSGYEKSRRQSYTFDRYVYIRLPVAGSLNDWGKYSISNAKNQTHPNCSTERIASCVIFLSRSWKRGLWSSYGIKY